LDADDIFLDATMNVTPCTASTFSSISTAGDVRSNVKKMAEEAAAGSADDCHVQE
jgi:hypothetical protein